MLQFQQNQCTVFHETFRADLTRNIVKHDKHCEMCDVIEIYGKYVKYGNMEIFGKNRPNIMKYLIFYGVFFTKYFRK